MFVARLFTRSAAVTLYPTSRCNGRHSAVSTFRDPLIRTFSSSVEPENKTDPEKRITLTEEVVNKLGKDEPTVKTLKVIEFECNTLYDEGAYVPEKLTLEHWQELLELSHSGRRKFLKFLAKNEIKELIDKQKRKARGEALRVAAAENAVKFQETCSSGIEKYGLNGNTIFMKILETTMANWFHNCVVQEMKFSNPIVLDFGYDSYMKKAELKSLADQISILWTQNRTHSRPVPITFCNAPRDGEFMKQMLKVNPRICDEDYPIPITEKHYLDLFPKEKLVYLTPDARTELQDFNEDDVYIVGGIVDKAKEEPLSYAKAKREGIRSAKLPLERHLHWGQGSKALTLNQAMAILLQLRYTGSWKVALEAVPRRKLKTAEELQEIMKRQAVREKMLRKRSSYDTPNNKFRFSV